MTSVVLADADEERRAASRFGLRAGQLEVVEVATLEGALRAVAEEQPVALVMDEQLCRAITAPRLVAALRAQPETSDIRLVLVTGIGSDIDVEGADVVLHHPTTPVDLVRAVVDPAGSDDA